MLYLVVLFLVTVVTAIPPLDSSEKLILDPDQYEESVVDYTAHPSLDPSGQILEGLLIHDRRTRINHFKFEL